LNDVLIPGTQQVVDGPLWHLHERDVLQVRFVVGNVGSTAVKPLAGSHLAHPIEY